MYYNNTDNDSEDEDINIIKDENDIDFIQIIENSSGTDEDNSNSDNSDNDDIVDIISVGNTTVTFTKNIDESGSSETSDENEESNKEVIEIINNIVDSLSDSVSDSLSDKESINIESIITIEKDEDKKSDISSISDEVKEVINTVIDNISDSVSDKDSCSDDNIYNEKIEKIDKITNFVSETYAHAYINYIIKPKKIQYLPLNNYINIIDCNDINENNLIIYLPEKNIKNGFYIYLNNMSDQSITIKSNIKINQPSIGPLVYNNSFNLDDSIYKLVYIDIDNYNNLWKFF